MKTRKVSVWLLAVSVLISSVVAAGGSQNVGTGDSAAASVDRPLSNHIKAFVDSLFPWLDELLSKSDTSPVEYTNSTNGSSTD